MRKTALGFLLILALFVPSLVNAQITSQYGNKEGTNPAAFTLTIYSPKDQTAYANTILLNFNITWTTIVAFPFPIGPSLKGDYAYCIDDSHPISIESNQSESDIFYVHPEGNFTINPHFSYSVNVSNLANGYHKIVIIAGLYRHSDYYYINQTTSPIKFLVQNPTSPTPLPIETPSSELTVGLSESASALNFGNTVNFTVTVEGGTKPYTYAWYLDNQLAETSLSPYFSTNSQAVGSHHVYVQVTDANNNSAKTLTVEFNVLPTSTLSPSPSSESQTPSTSSSPFTEPTETTNPNQNQTLPQWVIVGGILLAVVVLVVVAGLLVRKNRKST